MTNTEERYSAAWKQFLTARRKMLDTYDRAQAHSAGQTVQVHHGVVGEAAVRDWLSEFLPQKFGVCAGYIRSQGLPQGHQSGHFDVIVYDKLEAPTLWIEDNADKSESGRARIMPAENVLAIIEVKSRFNTTTVRDAIEKLGQLGPLTSDIDGPQDTYPRFLPATASLYTVFFEHLADDQKSLAPLNILRDARFNRFFYGAVILRSDAHHADETGIAKRLWGSDTVPEFGDLTTGSCMTANKHFEWKEKVGGSEKVERTNFATLMTWSDVNFRDFAFDLVAILKGQFRPGYASTLHGLHIPEQAK